MNRVLQVPGSRTICVIEICALLLYNLFFTKIKKKTQASDNLGPEGHSNALKLKALHVTT